MNLNRKWAFASVLALGTVVGAAAAGCGDDSTSTATAKDGGTPDTSTGDQDSGDQDSGPADSGSVYNHLGDRAGIATEVGKVITAVAADPQLLSYFAIRTGGVSIHTDPALKGDPSLDFVADCFTQFTANAAGGPEQYPYTSTDAGGVACRDMATAHNGLAITTVAFQKFITVAATQLTTDGVAMADLTALAGPLEGTSTQIVDTARDTAQAAYDSGVPNEAGTASVGYGSLNYGAPCNYIIYSTMDAGPDAAGWPSYDGGSAAAGCVNY